MPSNVKITSTGLNYSTKVYVGEEEMKGVHKVEWVADGKDGAALTKAIIHVYGPDIEIEQPDGSCEIITTNRRIKAAQEGEG